MGSSRVSCSEYSFPAAPTQRARIGIVGLLGFSLVDLSLFLTDARQLVAAPGEVARELGTALAETGLRCPDLFFAAGDTVEEIAPNQRDPGRRRGARGEFAAALAVAEEIGIPGLTILPGVSWAGDAAGAWAACVDELGWRADAAARAGVQLRVEPHAGSIVPVPEDAARLCAEVPGLRLTLDLSHFELQAVTLERVLMLSPLAGHLHIRAAKPGAIQVRWRENETDFGALLKALRAAGYDGGYCVEYVPMAKWRCDEVDVVTETIATRDALAALGVT